MNGECKSQKDPQVLNQMGGLSKGLSILHENIDNLTSRLGSILIPESPSEQKMDEKSSLVILADSIRTCKESVKDANFKVQDLIDRLEL